MTIGTPAVPRHRLTTNRNGIAALRIYNDYTFSDSPATVATFHAIKIPKIERPVYCRVDIGRLHPVESYAVSLMPGHIAVDLNQLITDEMGLTFDPFRQSLN